MLHVIPVNDIKEHTKDSTCDCGPSLIIENGEMILVHNAYDHRELVEQGWFKLSEVTPPTTGAIQVCGFYPSDPEFGSNYFSTIAYCDSCGLMDKDGDYHPNRDHFTHWKPI